MDIVGGEHMDIKLYDTIKDKDGPDFSKDTDGPNLTLEEQVKEIFASGDPDAIDDLILAEPEEVRALEEENEKLRKTIKELRVINDNWASGEPVEALKGRNEMLKDEKQKLESEVLACEADLEMARDDLEIARTDIKAMEDLVASLRNEINHLKQAHESEVAELNDEIMELKILAKKKNEYADALDDDSIAFGKIRSVFGKM